MSLANIFTKERVVYGIIISLIGLFGTMYTARTQASSATEEVLNNFRLETTKEIGAVKGDVQTLQSINKGIEKRLEGIESSLNTITSVLLKR